MSNVFLPFVSIDILISNSTKTEFIFELLFRHDLSAQKYVYVLWFLLKY